VLLLRAHRPRNASGSPQTASSLAGDEESGEEAGCGEEAGKRRRGKQPASSPLASSPLASSPRGGWAAGGCSFALLLRAWALNQLAFSYLFVGEHDAALAALKACAEACARIVAQEGGADEQGARRKKEKTENF
jgi:hypothetical protein